MNILFVKKVLKTAVVAIAVFMSFQNTVLAASGSKELFSLEKTKNSLSSLIQKTHDEAGKIQLAERRTLASGQRVNSACDDNGEPCPHDATQDDMS